ncbi:glucosamine inositolphosphorylceramide transferase family protein [Methylobacterium planeticum]|uniref:Formyl transferase n=1 Tax=Methylobacterium planeticum TaxID=2615211 RepID=A0A6N6MQG0_9HYPH|nr:formyl transferase [Methylobacterium planeticum]KAB1072573.1 formyl transferase [Methylobacterium planeticum]
MRIRLRLDGRHARRWHARLIEHLARRPDTVVEVEAGPGPDTWPANADLLFRLEALIHGLPADGPAAHLDAPARSRWPSPGTEAPDRIIDLCGDVPDDGPVPVWRVLYDGQGGEAALLASLLAGRAPIAELVEGNRLRCSGRLGTEIRGVALTMFEDALVRTATMIRATLDGRAPILAADAPDPAPLRLRMPDLGRRAVRLLGGAIVRRLYHLCYCAPHWRVGWRRLHGPDLVALGRHPESGWRELADDGRRFYADPFPIEHRGEPWLFVEEYVHSVGKALISAVRFSPEGPVGVPVPVLETGSHLSYPFVFAREGSVWMVPESCAAGTIDLYRALAFPGGWAKEATLISGIAASDATLLEHGGRWWMFATVRGSDAADPLGNGSFSDTLHLWSAPDFRGPWTPHPANPVLIDIAAARPAGRIVKRGNDLIRPVQDCTRGYGHALALARIERLDDEAFTQHVETRIEAGPAWPGTRLHTLNAAAGYEFIDGSARAPRFRRPHRP